MELLFILGLVSLAILGGLGLLAYLRWRRDGQVLLVAVPAGRRAFARRTASSGDGTTAGHR